MTQTILVVDDEILITTLLKDTLEDEGYTVLTFTEGKAAADALPTSDVEIIITDYHMPEFNGLDLLKRVNELRRELDRNMLVIVLSAQKDSTIALELVKNDAFSYQSKPLDIQRLLMDVSRAITKLTLP